jgi:archaea-specific DNA-binding protein
MISQQTLYFSNVHVPEMSTGNAKTDLKSSNEVFIGKKPLMTYVTATLVQLANEPTVIIKARGKSITRAVDVAQIIVKRMDTLGYKIGQVKIGSEVVKSDDGRNRNVSTIEISVSREK